MASCMGVFRASARVSRVEDGLYYGRRGMIDTEGSVCQAADVKVVEERLAWATASR